MKILYCVWRMGLGGAERQLVQLCRELVRRGHEIIVGRVFDGELDAALAATGAAIERIPASHKHDLRVVPRLAKLVARVKPDVVQTWLTQMDLVGGFAARMNRVPWILSERSSAGNYPNTIWNLSRRVWGGRATAVVANSEGGRRYWLDRLGAENVHVIRNIVPVEEIEAVIVPPETREIILHVGRFTAVKNLDTLIKALPIVFRARPDAEAVLCGDGVLRAGLEQLARDLGIADRVTFTGSVSNVWEWMKRASVSVALSFHEGHPNAVLESIAARAPLVCSDIAAHREIVDGTMARMVDPKSAEGVAAGIVEVLTNRNEAKARAKRALAALACCSAGAVAGQYEAVYREISGRTT